MIYVFLADGFEETEAIAPIDMLRRAKLDVKLVGVGTSTPTSSHGIRVTADLTEAETKLDSSVQLIVLPGGMPGTLNLEKSPFVQSAIKYCVENGIPVGAICAAPSILGKLGLLNVITAVFAGAIVYGISLISTLDFRKKRRLIKSVGKNL